MPLAAKQQQKTTECKIVSVCLFFFVVSAKLTFLFLTFSFSPQQNLVKK